MPTDDGSAEILSSIQKRQWKRVLYERQPYRDNYTDPVKFLDQLDLVTHCRNKDISYFSVFTSASAVAQQFTVVASFLVVYKYVLTAQSLKVISLIDITLLLFGYGIHICYDNDKQTLKHRSKDTSKDT